MLLGSAIAVPLAAPQRRPVARRGRDPDRRARCCSRSSRSPCPSRLDPDDELEPRTTRRAEESGAAIGGRGRPHASRGAAALMTTLGLRAARRRLRPVRARRRAASATELGMSERMLGLTVISIGCALPELIGSLVAASPRPRRARDRLGDRLEPAQRVPRARGHRRTSSRSVVGERMHVVELVGLVAITLLGILMLRGSRQNLARSRARSWSPRTSRSSCCPPCSSCTRGREDLRWVRPAAPKPALHCESSAFLDCSDTTQP